MSKRRGSWRILWDSPRIEPDMRVSSTAYPGRAHPGTDGYLWHGVLKQYADTNEKKQEPAQDLHAFPESRAQRGAQPDSHQ